MQTATKYQLTIPEALLEELKSEAERQGVPLAQWIRETMSAKLAEAQQKRAGELGNPLAPFIGMLDTGETDLSTQVDDILYS